MSEICGDEDHETLENAFNELEAMKEAESWPHLQYKHEDENSKSEDSDTQAGSNKQVLPVNSTQNLLITKEKNLKNSCQQSRGMWFLWMQQRKKFS